MVSFFLENSCFYRAGLSRSENKATHRNDSEEALAAMEAVDKETIFLWATRLIIMIIKKQIFLKLRYMFHS